MTDKDDLEKLKLVLLRRKQDVLADSLAKASRTRLERAVKS